MISGFPALGEGSDTVYLHGAFGDHTFFRGLVEKLGGVAFSRRGRHGVPPADARGVTFADYLADSRKVLEALGGKPVVVGHSLGALLAMHLAAEGRCRAAVLVAPAPPGMLTAQPRTLPWLAPSLPRILAGLPFRPSDAAFRAVAVGRVPDAQRVLATFGHESGKVYRTMLLGTGRPPSRPQCPVLVVGGGDDWIISPRLLQRTARFCNAELQVHPAMGHWLLEEPERAQVEDGIARWVEKLPAAG